MEKVIIVLFRRLKFLPSTSLKEEVILLTLESDLLKWIITEKALFVLQTQKKTFSLHLSSHSWYLNGISFHCGWVAYVGALPLSPASQPRSYLLATHHIPRHTDSTQPPAREHSPQRCNVRRSQHSARCKVKKNKQTWRPSLRSKAI